MNDDCKISIVLPTHDGEKYLAQSIASCLSQTYSNLELIVVDDGSAGDIAKIVQSFSDPRIKFIRHPKNLGLPAALNTGFGLARGKFLTWTSDDNCYLPNAIKQMLDYLHTHEEVDFVYTDCQAIDHTGKLLGKITILPPEFIQFECCVGYCFLYRREVYNGIGMYDTGLFLVEDYDYWIRVSKEYQVKKINQVLYYTRFHDRSLTYNYMQVRSEQKLKQYKKLVRKHFNNPVWLRYYWRAKILALEGKKISSLFFAIRSICRQPLSVLINLHVSYVVLALRRKANFPLRSKMGAR